MLSATEFHLLESRKNYHHVSRAICTPRSRFTVLSLSLSINIYTAFVFKKDNKRQHIQTDALKKKKEKGGSGNPCVLCLNVRQNLFWLGFCNASNTITRICWFGHKGAKG